MAQTNNSIDAPGFPPLTVNLGGTNATAFVANSLVFTSTPTALSSLASANNGVLVSNNTGVPNFLSGTGITGNILQSSASAAPTWSSAIYPSATTINQILFSSATNTITGISSVNQAALTYDINGVPTATALAATQSIVGVQGLSPALATIPGNNRLINESFFVWQRGAGGSAVIAVPASTTVYTADRWQIVTNASQACTVTQAAGALSGTFMAQVQRNSGQTGTGVIKFGQSLTRDMGTAMSGAAATITFKALAGANFSSASSVLTVSLITGTGSTDISGISGAAYPGSVTQSTTFTLTSTLTTFFTTFTVAAGVTQICVAFSYTPVGTASTSDYFSVTDVQLEKSANPTAIERKTWAQTEHECKFFYNKSFVYGTAPAQNIGVGTDEQIFAESKGAASACTSPTISFEREMFAAPTMVYFSPGAASAQAWDETASFTTTATATRFATAKQVVVNYTSASAINGGATGNVIGLHWTAEAELT